MTEPSAADPFSTFLNTHSGHQTFGGLPTPTGQDTTSGLPGDAWTVLEALNQQRAIEVTELKATTRLSTVQLVRLLTLLEKQGLARVLPNDEDDIAMITSAGWEALAGHTSD